ncbi:MAG: DUF433 domain-containing protein [Thermodesulfobacteriota bacterium]
MRDLLNRITFDKNVLCGKPIIRGLRISVEMILELLAKGELAKQNKPLLWIEPLK